MSGQLLFRGELNEAELRHLYTRASIFVGTSRYEPFGLSPLEAALSRCALLLNDIPSFREIWGESACYFQTNDAGDSNGCSETWLETGNYGSPMRIWPTVAQPACIPHIAWWTSTCNSTTRGAGEDGGSMSKLNIHFFAHSWISDWNHGNAHFLRGLAQALVDAGHKVCCYEPLGAWSLTNLVREEGRSPQQRSMSFVAPIPDLDVQFYQPGERFEEFATRRLKDADLVLIHEWNEPEVVNTILRLKNKLGFERCFTIRIIGLIRMQARFFDSRLDLFDGVLAFGEAIRKIYVDGFGFARAWTFHEAADTDKFKRLPAHKEMQLVWVGNWGDEERTRELQEFLIEPARS